ncbi:MAG: hypothetical protein PHD60_09295 [Clostridia bacterium]|nr:hypothetical protein [Clostridia bacterium]
MNCLNRHFVIELASPADAEEILKIYESGDFKGNISVLYTRRPDPVKSLMQEGDKVVIPIIKEQENGKICGMGCCVIRKAYLNGEIKNIGYLTGLKILPEYRKKRIPIADVYAFLYEQTKNDVDIYYTTILKENTLAQKMLEKKRKNMPEYKYKGDYTVFCFRTGQKVFENNNYILQRGHREGLLQFFKEQEKQYQFSPLITSMYENYNKDIFTLSDPKGNILAVCLVWDQQAAKQYIITEYKGIYKILQRMPTKLFGYPPLPQKNISANYACISMLYIKDNNLKLAKYFIKKIAKCSKKYEFLMLGLFDAHPLKPIFNHMKHLKYQSRLYIVSWNDERHVLDNRPINLEVSLL